MTTISRLALALGSSLTAVALLAACGATGASPNTARTAPALGAPTHGSSGSAPASTAGGTAAFAADGAALGTLTDRVPASAPEPAAGAGSGAAADPGSGAAAAGTEPDLQQAVIRTGEIDLTTKDPSHARSDVLEMVTALGGEVANEVSSSDDHGRIDRVDLTLRIPSARFEDALDRLGRLGSVTNRQQSSQDVTTQVIDIAARVKAQAASVASIRQLLARATTIGEVISIESALSSRQATLDSLEHQQKYLADQTSLSTVQVSLTRPASHHVAPVKHPHRGFLGGLQRGWHALGRIGLALGTGIGAAVPFAALALLLGTPVALVLRGRRRTAPTAPAEV